MGVPVLYNFCQFEQYFFEDVVLIYFAIEVYIQLNSNLAVLQHSSQGFKDEVQESIRGLLLFKDFDYVLFEEVFDRSDALEQPVLSQARHEIVYMFKGRFVTVEQNFA